MTFPKQIQNLIEAFERLPGVGAKTAERLTFYLLSVPDSELTRFAESLTSLKPGVSKCAVCKNFSEGEICEIDADKGRNQHQICVVESPLDVFSLERAGSYTGVYHVLHGVINPLNNIGPDELYITDLLERVKADSELEEVILALNPTMEGEATAMYLTKKLHELNPDLKVSRLGVGVPIGGDLQYADSTTLARALEGRRSFN